jgi:hypothetical protein
VDEFFTVKDESRSAVFEAAWWMPEESEAIVALGNISDAPTTATVNFGNHHARTVHLQPHATELVREQHRKEGAESVKIDVTGAAGSIVPTGIITTEDGSFNSVIRFYDPTKAKQPNLYANGFRVFGTTPHMVLKNTTQSSIAVLPKISPLTGSAGITLSQVSLNPNETKEVDLSDLLRAAKTRSDLHVVSVEVTNWVAPGSVIGSLYATNKRTGIIYDVPLRDSGPIRSMTGAYPWKIDGDYKSITYITNITDEPVGFAVELAYDGGKFTLGPQKLQPRETATFDLGKIRDERMKDIAGHTLPGNVTHGQFKWAIRGASNGKIVLIGRTEMVSRNQDISSSYSCPMDCGPTYEPTGTFPTDLFNGQSGQASVTETASWNYGYTIGPYPASASWSADDPAIVTFDPSSASTTTLTPEDAGSTLVTGLVGWQDRYDWDGLECFYEGSFPEVVDSILDMLLAVEFVDAHIENTDNTAAFIPLYNTANLEPHEYSVPGACSGDNFILKVRFRVPSESANCCSNDTTSFVVLPPNNKFHFVDVIPDLNPLNPHLSRVFYGNDNPAFVRIGLKKNLDGSGTNNSVKISVGGEYGSGEPYRGNGTVHLVCP